MERVCSVLGVVALIFMTASSAMGATASGTVAGSQGQTMSGIEVFAKDAAGHVAGQATTGNGGAYQIMNLQPGNYNFTLDPGSSGVQGQTVSSYVGPDGICLNWGVSANSPAVATAQPGATCAGMAAADPAWDPAPWIGAGAAVVAGAAIGVGVGVGSGSESSRKSPSSAGQ